MIKATIQNSPYCTEMTFPCTETELLKKLEEIGIDKDHLAPTGMVIDIEPKELSVLMDCDISLDALNYLGKRMDGMEHLEEEQFLAVLSCDELNIDWGLKNIINLTFNLPRYTLIKDTNDLERAGRTHLLNIRGCLFVSEAENKEWLAEEGKKLIDSGKGIDTEYGTLFVNEEIAFDEMFKDHHNVVFVGTDENDVPKQASLRSTISFGNAFRITVSSSDTKYSFSHFGESEKLFVFEAPIDLLSFITLYQKEWKKHSYIAMNGVYENAVLEALKCYSNLDEVVICTDNDIGGIDAAERLRDILHENGYENIFRITPRNKDFNEDLKELHGLTPIPSTSHLRKELFSENVLQLEFKPINLSRVTDNLNVTLSRNKYADISNIALSASAEILAKVNERSTENIFENLQKYLRKGYRAYTDRGKMSSKMDTLKNSHFEAVKNIRNYPATKEKMKIIAKSLFDLADSALKCSTEQQMSEQQEQEESPQQNIEIKMSM